MIRFSSKKASFARSNETPCFEMFDWFFRLSHSTQIGPTSILSFHINIHMFMCIFNTFLSRCCSLTFFEFYATLSYLFFCLWGQTYFLPTFAAWRSCRLSYTQTSDRSAAIWGVSPCMGLLGALNWHGSLVFISRRVLLAHFEEIAI